MKQLYLLLVLVLYIISGCNNDNSSNVSSSKTKLEINNILNSWHKSASIANYDTYFDAMDSISVYIGTDASENWTKKEFANFSKPYFDKGKAWDFKPIERNIYFSNNGEVVWFDELLDTWMGICRGSGILEKSDNKWRIKHYVLSVSIPNNDIRAVIKDKIKSDSVFLLRYSK